MSVRRYKITKSSKQVPKNAYITFMVTPISYGTETDSADPGLSKQNNKVKMHKRLIDRQVKKYIPFDFLDEGFRLCQ